QKYHTSMLMITHDLGIVAEVCDEVSIAYAGRIIEHGTLEDIFDHMAHPYTEGLFGALPDIEARRSELKPIKGLMPDPTNLPTGCPFHPRCDYVTERCSLELPQKRWLSDTHYVQCHLYDHATESVLQGGNHVE
ncbi:MAG: ABC transporter ATP-binding protein, partial [Oscillospiraceae bacterium]